MRKAIFVFSLALLIGAAGCYIWFLIPPVGSQLLPITYANDLERVEDDNWGFINEKGRVVISGDYILSGSEDLLDEDRLLAVGLEENGRTTVGIFNLETRELITHGWDDVHNFDEAGYAAVSKEEPATRKSPAQICPLASRGDSQ